MTQETITALKDLYENESLEDLDKVVTSAPLYWANLGRSHRGNWTVGNVTAFPFLNLKPVSETEQESIHERAHRPRIEDSDNDIMMFTGNILRPAVRRFVLSGTGSSMPAAIRPLHLVNDPYLTPNIVTLLLTSEVVPPRPTSTALTDINSIDSASWMSNQLANLLTSEVALLNPASIASPDVVSSEPAQNGVSIRLENAFRNSSDELFEGGMESNLSKVIESAILELGEEAVKSVDEIIRSEISNLPTKIEALRWIGLVEHSASRDFRTSILCKYLKDPEIRIRDAALIGLSDLNESNALPPLKDAFENESSAMLKRNMRAVIGQFENAKR